MTIVPEMIEELSNEYRQEFEAWLSHKLYQEVVRNADGHLLVRLQARLDFAALEIGCRGFYHESGPGAKPVHGIRRLVRVLLVKYLYNWSLRETEERLRHDLVVKWFVGYGVLQAVVDHSQLERFEQWVQRHQPRLYFDTVLAQIDHDYPAERTAVQIGDTFAMRADAAQENLVELLRHTSRCLLRALAPGAGEQQPDWLEGLDMQRLFGPEDEPLLYFMTRAQKQQQRENTAWGAWQLAQRVRQQLPQLAEPLCTRVQLRLDNLDKILADEFQLSLDGHGQLVQLTERDPKHKGEYRLCSATDPDATARNHGGESTVGFNMSLAGTVLGIIRAISAATGAQPDQAGVAPLIQQQRQYQGCCPAKLIYDQAAGAGRTRALVDQTSDGQTQLVARIPPSSSPGRFGPEDFQLNDQGALVCPAGRTTTQRHYNQPGEGLVFHFTAQQCQDCSLAQQCRSPKASLLSQRSVFLSDYLLYIRQARDYNHTQAFRTEMRLRPLIERIIFMLTHYDGARRARRRGIHWADFQAKMCAMARNVRTWLKLLAHRSARPHSQPEVT